MSDVKPPPFIPEHGFLLGVAPNGARKTKADHPSLPLSARELAIEAAACLEAGATFFHLHIRDENGRHSLDPGIYRETISQIQKAVGDKLIIQMTSEAVGIYTPQQQMQAVRDVEPEAVSIAIREFLPYTRPENKDTQGERAKKSLEEGFQSFLFWLEERKIAVQYILYDDQDLERFFSLQARGVIPSAHRSVLFVLGRYAADQRSSPGDLLPFLQSGRHQDLVWSLCAFGQNETACAVSALCLGGHPRIGFENNLLLADGSRADSNASLVKSLISIAKSLGKTPFTANQGRNIFR